MHPKPPSPIRQPGGDLLIPAQTVALLEQTLRTVLQDLEMLQGQSWVAPGQMETGDETVQRQEFVDNLSASAGVNAPLVTPRRLPDRARVVANSASLDELRTLVQLLFDKA